MQSLLAPRQGAGRAPSPSPSTSRRNLTEFVAASLSHHSLLREPLISRLEKGATDDNDTCSQNRAHAVSMRERVKKFYDRFGVGHLIPIIVLVLYSLLGGAIFYSLEAPLKEDVTEEQEAILENANNQFRKRMWECHISNYSMKRMFEEIDIAMSWYQNKTIYADSLNPVSGNAIDSYWAAIFYCTTIYTTIGYGTIVPTSDLSRVITMLYAVIGIPLTFSVLNDLGDVMSRKLILIWLHFTRRFIPRCRNMCRKQAKVLSSVQFSESEKQLHNLPMTVALGLTIAWMFLCSAIFMTWEDKWSYFTAFYFFFVSLTTIGLGDTVPQHINYMISSFGLLIIGLSLVSMCIQVAQAKVEHFVQNVLFAAAQMQKAMHEQQIGGALGKGESADALDKVLAGQPKLFRTFLMAKGKRQLEETVEKKLFALNAQTQTDPDPNENGNIIPEVYWENFLVINKLKQKVKELEFELAAQLNRPLQQTTSQTRTLQLNDSTNNNQEQPTKSLSSELSNGSVQKCDSDWEWKAPTTEYKKLLTEIGLVLEECSELVTEHIEFE